MNNLIAIGIPDTLLDANHTTVDAERWAEAMAILKAGKGIYLHGDAGRGKSFLAAAILRNLIDRAGNTGLLNNCIRFQGTSELICEIRATFAGKAAETDIDIIDRYSSYDMLVLDDLGVNKPSEFVVQTFDMIIDFRYKTQRTKKTIITSNLSLDELSAKYDDRIASRIAGMCEVLKIGGEDRRMRR